MLTYTMIDTNYSAKELMLPYLFFLIGILLQSLGSLLKESLFQEYEFSETRFFCMNGFCNLFFFSTIIYPIISQIKCTHFNRYFFTLCTNNLIDHPVFAFETFFLSGSDYSSSVSLILLLFFLCLFYNLRTFTRIKLTKLVSINQKLLLQNIKIILIFVLEICCFDLASMKNGSLRVNTFILRSFIKCLSFICFVLSSILIYEIYPIKFCGLSQKFGRYFFQFEVQDDNDSFDLDKNISQLENSIYSKSIQSIQTLKTLERLPESLYKS